MKSSHKLLLLAVTVMLTFACQIRPVSDIEIIARSRQNMAAIDSYHMGMDVSATTQGMTITIQTDGVVQMPDQSYMTMTMLGQQFELLVLGPAEMYMRQAGTSDWIPISPAAASQANVRPNAAGELALLEFVTNLRREGNETIDGVECYHLVMDVDTQKAIALSSPEMAGQVEPGSTPATMQMWTGTRDFLIRKITLDMSLAMQGTEMSMGLTITFSNFDEPVEIPRP